MNTTKLLSDATMGSYIHVQLGNRTDTSWGPAEKNIAVVLGAYQMGAPVLTRDFPIIAMRDCLGNIYIGPVSSAKEMTETQEAGYCTSLLSIHLRQSQEHLDRIGLDERAVAVAVSQLPAIEWERGR